MAQPSPASESEDLTDSEESVYSGLEDSGSDSTSSGEEEEEEEGLGSTSPPGTHPGAVGDQKPPLGVTRSCRYEVWG